MGRWFKSIHSHQFVSRCIQTAFGSLSRNIRGMSLVPLRPQGGDSAGGDDADTTFDNPISQPWSLHIGNLQTQK